MRYPGRTGTAQPMGRFTFWALFQITPPPPSVLGIHPPWMDAIPLIHIRYLPGLEATWKQQHPSLSTKHSQAEHPPCNWRLETTILTHCIFYSQSGAVVKVLEYNVGTEIRIQTTLNHRNSAGGLRSGCLCLLNLPLGLFLWEKCCLSFRKKRVLLASKSTKACIFSHLPADVQPFLLIALERNLIYILLCQLTSTNYSGE